MPFTVTPSSNGEVAYRSQLPNEVAFESLASRLRPFTANTTVTLSVEVPSASHSVAAHADTDGLDAQG